VLDRLREFDVKLALDDFGAGYTSFMYLSDLQADVIKIDGAIVESAARHPSRLSIVQAISDLSRNLGMRSIAEWVEDAATLRAMAEVGIDYIQGFGIARPMPPARNPPGAACGALDRRCGDEKGAGGHPGQPGGDRRRRHLRHRQEPSLNSHAPDGLATR
jgi:EAL domain-containing protein (putative c-di-GMP-specific phosphodiesterase class I)